MLNLLGLALLIAGGPLILLRMPVLALPRVVRQRTIDRAEFLDIVIEESEAGRTPFAAVNAALVAFERAPAAGPEAVAEVVEPFLPQYASLWRLLHSRGSGLLDAAIALREGEWNRARLAEELEVKLAGTRATMRLLVWLPWAFLVVGQLAGMDSLDALMRHVWGYPLMAMAGLLTWSGFRWAERIIRSALT